MPNRNKLGCLTLSKTSTLVQYLPTRLEPTKVELLKALHSNGRLPALPTNIILWLQGMKMPNPLAYYNMGTINAK